MGKVCTALLALLLMSGCAVIRLPLVQPPSVQEVTVFGEGQEKVLLVEIAGILSFHKPWAPPGFPRGDSLPARLRKQLDRARSDPHVRALLVRIDSPGGTVTASDVLFHEISSFRDETGIPVVASIVEKGLSGGYYVALAADEIIAHPTSLVGSMGVFVTKFDISELLSSWGVRTETTKSGPQKDILSPLRPLSEEERKTLDSLVEELAQRFEETVRVARVEVGDADLECMKSAAPFTASRALELHMIDRIGYLKDAFQAALSLAGLSSARLITYAGAGDGAVAAPYDQAATHSMQGEWAGSLLFLDPERVHGFLQGQLSY